MRGSASIGRSVPKQVMKAQLDCPCGEHIVGDNEDDLVEKVNRHVAKKHPGHEYSRQPILSMAY
jgi:predicted small metal-binding protein